MRPVPVGLIVAAMVVPSQAQAQAQAVALGAEATTDERRRGLSWSDGDPALSVDATAALAGFDLSARAVTTRGSSRHAGADGVLDLDVSRGFDLGVVTLRARVIGHLFAGATGSQDYYEVGGLARYTLGPVTLDAGASYAPNQRAIGGDNLYLFANARAGIPTTPFSVNAGVGRSSGSVDEPPRATRLRPAGRYVDWHLGLAWVKSPLTIAVDYVGNDIDSRRNVPPLSDRKNSGDRILGRVRVDF